MLADKDRIFTNLYGLEDWGLKGAMARGNWDNTKGLIDKGRDWIVNEMKASGLRGRGGAGFPTGVKWSFMPKQSDGRPHYLVVNADESEPGTCKDREIMRHDPHTLVEGCLIAGFAMGAHAAYIYVRGEFIRERERLQAAVDQAHDAGLIGKNNKNGWDFEIVVHHGAGAYICGEETGLLESLEGKKGLPRLKPPFPAASASMAARPPSTTSKSIAVAPTILRRGAAWFAGDRPAQQCRHQAVLHLRPRREAVHGRRGDGDHAPRTDRDPCRRRPRRLGQSARGHSGRSLRALPAGEPMQRPVMDFDSLAKLRSGLGTAAVIVMDKSTDIVRAISRLSYFYKHESCGQCTPCREGTGWMWRVLERMADGRAEKREIDLLLDVTTQVEGHTICALGDAAAWPVPGPDRAFPARDRAAHRRVSGAPQAGGRRTADGGGVEAMAAEAPHDPRAQWSSTSALASWAWRCCGGSFITRNGKAPSDCSA